MSTDPFDDFGLTPEDYANDRAERNEDRAVAAERRAALLVERITGALAILRTMQTAAADAIDAQTDEGAEPNPDAITNAADVHNWTTKAIRMLSEGT